VNVLIALGGVGSGVQLEESLASAGFAARWDAARADGPGAGAAPVDVVVLDADQLGARLVEVARAWRDHPAVPGVIAIGGSAAAREHASAARVALVAPNASTATLAAAIRDAARLRLAAGMRWSVLCAALKLPIAEPSPVQHAIALAAARSVEVEIPRAALRWHTLHYVTPTDLLDQLIEDRVLTVPELDTVRKIDGTRTVQSHVKLGPLEPSGCARLVWALASLGALDLTPEVRDVATPRRRALAEIRRHVRARSQRLERSTYYDVLELTPLAEYEHIEAAYQLVAWRFGPQALAQHDLADLAPLVAPMWEVVEKARSVLVDDAARGRYADWLRTHVRELRTTWVIDHEAATVAAEAFTRGQRALGEGDAHRAMRDLAMACRQHPGHPDYEANLAWARLRVQVASGRDQREAADAERRAVEELMIGRRPWPRALVALALLCAAAGDPEAARWHLHVALTVDPNVPAAAALAQRLGLRR
jgi:hypothetical protein